jgi:glutamate racemase
VSKEPPAQLNDQPIGVFDSGLGGLTVVRELTEAMPAESIVYLGDTARVPYGIKSPETIRRFAMEDLAFLLSFQPKLVVVACNTASAAAIGPIEAACPVGVVDVIRPSAAAAVAAVAGTDKAIGVIGTEATVNSGAYQRQIEALDAGRVVMARPCPLLVPIVEEGRDEDNAIVLHVLCDYLSDLQRLRPGALILGCTHYPLLANAIGKLMGPQVRLISSAQAAAEEVQRRLRSTGLASPPGRAGTLRYYTTDNPQRFAWLGERFGRRPIDHVELVGTDELEFRPQRTASPT